MEDATANVRAGTRPWLILVVWPKKMNEDAILTDVMFWGRLARVAGASMAASSDVDLRRQWIDDLLPQSSKRSNSGLQTEGISHVMGHPNGKFGAYRFFALLPWSLVRHPDRESVIEEIELDHSRKELRFIVAVAPEKKPNQATQTTPGQRPSVSDL